MPRAGTVFSLTAVDEAREPVGDEEVLTLQENISDAQFQEILRGVARDAIKTFPDDHDGFCVEIMEKVGEGGWRMSSVPFTKLLK